MRTIINFVLLTAIRDWLLLGIFIILLMALGLAFFMGNTALVEQSEMTLAYFAGSSRIILNVGMIIFVCFHIRRSFENREIESMLSKPISRDKFIISYWMGFSILAILMCIPICLILMIFNNPDSNGMFFWASSLIFEVSLIVCFALMTSLIVKSAVTAVMSCFAFYLMSRLMGFFVAAMYQPTSLMGQGTLGSILEFILKIISTIIPRLDLFAKSNWLIYGIDKQIDLWIHPVQFIVFTTLLLVVAIFDFKRKEF